MKRRSWSLLLCALLVLAYAGSAGAQIKKEAPAPKSATKSADKTPLIDINSASKDELKALQGVGDVTAQKIIDNRPYKNKTQLVSKKIVSQSVYDKISGQIIAKQAPAAPAKKKGGA
jgi:DNA uptake protein ComE-like DNA-binding protein